MEDDANQCNEPVPGPITNVVLKPVALKLCWWREDVDIDMVVFAHGRSFVDSGGKSQGYMMLDRDCVSDPYQAVNVHTDGELIRRDLNSIPFEIQTDVALVC